MTSLIKTLQEEARKKFREQDFFQGNFVHGVTGFKDGAGVIGQVCGTGGFLDDLILSTATTLINTAVERLESIKHETNDDLGDINGSAMRHENRALTTAQNIIKGLGEEK